MSAKDRVVLGAGIVGTCVSLHLRKRGCAVAPRHASPGFACGHANRRLTPATVTGRRVAERVAGGRPFVDPARCAAVRFGR
jgi:glycine/D-amino acid oxidase-like deaminating enzyme